jgi:hypothetical protein
MAGKMRGSRELGDDMIQCARERGELSIKESEFNRRRKTVANWSPSDENEDPIPIPDSATPNLPTIHEHRRENI